MPEPILISAYLARLEPLPTYYGTERCDFCGRRIRGNRHSIVGGAAVFNFHHGRRACRRAAREELSRHRTCVVMPPESSRDVDPAAYGAALAGFDYVTLPWWMRRVPERWLDELRREVAVKVGGIVERACYLKANGLEDGDA